MSLLAGCTQEDAPEQRIREMIGQAERMIEDRSLADAGALLSDTYRDPEQRSKQQLLRLLGGYFLRHRSIHLLVQIDRIDLPEPERARVTLYAAMAANPFSAVDAPAGLQAALYRFDLALILEADEWRLLSGSWQPATREDFLGRPH